MRILELQHQWRFTFFTPHRTIIKEGKLTKQCRKAPKVSISNIQLFYYLMIGLPIFTIFRRLGVWVGGEMNLVFDGSSSSSDLPQDATGNSVTHHRTIDLLRCNVVDIASNQTAFQILSAQKAFVVYTKDPSEKSAWIRLVVFHYLPFSSFSLFSYFFQSDC